MIVRIATEGQYELAEEDHGSLNELDNLAVVACEAGDEDRFRDVFTQLLDLVRSRGSRVEDDDLRGSDVIFPPPDVSLDEARADFTGEGLIPG